MKRNWGRISLHYLKSLGSFLYYVPYAVYQGAKTAYYFAKRNYEESGYSLNGFLAHVFLYPILSIYHFLLGSYELGTGNPVPWDK